MKRLSILTKNNPYFTVNDYRYVTRFYHNLSDMYIAQIRYSIDTYIQLHVLSISTVLEIQSGYKQRTDREVFIIV